MVVLAVVAVGCSSDDADEGAADGSTSSSTSSTTAAPAVAGVAAGDRYVALGSSIASGFGISEQSTSCGRSTRNYPRLIAAELELELVDVTCGGAQIRHVVDEPQGDNPPQIEAVTAETKLITVTVGGNDIAYNATALGCGDPAGVCTPPATLEQDVVSTRAALTSMVEELADRAPDATIVLVTYPREVPATGNCPELSFTDAEVEVVRDMGERLQELFLDLAEETGVVLVDPYGQPGEHTGCAPQAERWVSGSVADDGFAYHPTALGHRVMADLVLDRLAERS